MMGTGQCSWIADSVDMLCRYVMGYVSTVFFLAFTVLMMIMGEEQSKGAHERLVPNDHA